VGCTVTNKAHPGLGEPVRCLDAGKGCTCSRARVAAAADAMASPAGRPAAAKPTYDGEYAVKMAPIVSFSYQRDCDVPACMCAPSESGNIPLAVQVDHVLIESVRPKMVVFFPSAASNKERPERQLTGAGTLAVADCP
jgi:hypothetical protein